MNEDNVEAPPMADPPQTEEPGCLRVHHHARTWHLEKEPTIVRDLVMLADLSADDDIGLSACHSIGRLQNKPENCDVPIEVSGELPNAYEHEQYLMLRDENKALVKQISTLKEKVQKLKDQEN
ncbi:hypothetical protein GIB67_001538 [Kingdonia uniflora]|uniref:Uncharacterized protein n=1 Tax=Kingdonia uniflora TaxID=39325 RepID=A0A7J7LZC2_9MAGN|nr:hypothetical protein GIB67_001538 [Kingdonia uniflora]